MSKPKMCPIAIASSAHQFAKQTTRAINAGRTSGEPDVLLYQVLSEAVLAGLPLLKVESIGTDAKQG